MRPTPNPVWRVWIIPRWRSVDASAMAAIEHQIEIGAGGARSPRRWLTAAAAAGWAIAIAVACGVLLRYEFAPGPAPAAAANVVTGLDALALDAVCPTVVVAVHPQCPCTRATLASLAAVLGDQPGIAAVRLVVCGRTTAGGAFGDPTSNMLPGAVTLWDDTGALAASLGAVTSGTVIVLEPSGSVLFRGGITPSRGHEGDCQGRRLLVAAIQGRRATAATPVFGCPLTEAVNRRCPLCNEDAP